VALTDIAGVAREGLLARSVAVGLQVMAELMDDEVTAAVVGLKHAQLADRTALRPTTVDHTLRATIAGAGHDVLLGFDVPPGATRIDVAVETTRAAAELGLFDTHGPGCRSPDSGESTVPSVPPAT